MSSPTSRINRRTAMKQSVAAGFAFPAVIRTHATAAPSETLYHASFGTSGMAAADIGSLTASPYVKLVAVADVDLRNLGRIKKSFPDVKVYQDWRDLLDKEKNLNSVNVSTPDHMHASITMRAMQQGLHVYTQKPLSQTIYEARQLTRVALEKKLVTQMGIQIHSHEVHRTIVAIIQAGTIGKVREVHSWSGKHWGDRKPMPSRVDAVPKDLNWNAWLGVASERPYLARYYHPGEWRKHSISEPERLATWDATFSIRFTRRWLLPPPPRFDRTGGRPMATTGALTPTCVTSFREPSTRWMHSRSSGMMVLNDRRQRSRRWSARGT